MEPENITPSQKQLDYAEALGINVYPGITRKEISVLISIKVDDDKPASERHLSFAREYGMNPPPVIGKKALFDQIKWEINEPERINDLVAWFTFRVYRHLVNGKIGLPIDSPHHPIILEIADHLAYSPAIIKSIQKYFGRKLIFFGELDQGGSTNTIAYRETASLLRERLDLPMHTYHAPLKQIVSRPIKKLPKSATKDQRNGCLILVIITMLCIIYLFFKK